MNNNKANLLATIAFLAVTSFLINGGIGTQTAEAGSGPGCNHEGGASTTLDPNISFDKYIFDGFIYIANS